METYAFSGLAGGVGAELSGGNFWEGAAIGVMNAGLNHLQSVVDEAGRRYFSNRDAAYEYMWKNSFDEKGKPKVENAGWYLSDGSIIVMPNDKNTLTESILSGAYKGADGALRIKFNGKSYKIAATAHTHPTKVSRGIGIGEADFKIYNDFKKPLSILYNKRIYYFDGGRNMITGEATYKDIGTWIRK